MASKNEFVIEATVQAQGAVDRLNYIFSQGTASAEKFYKEVSGLAGKKITFTPAIRYEVDASGLLKPVAYLKEQGNLLKDIYASQERLNRVQAGSATNLRQSLNYAKQQRDELIRLTTTADDYGRKIKSVNPAWDEANKRVQSLSRQLEIASASNFWQKIKAELNLGSVLAAGNAVNSLVNTFQSLSIVIAQIQAPIRAFSQALNDIQQIDLTFKGIGGGPADISKVFADSASIATQYGVNLKTVREGFQQLTPVILSSGGTLDNVSEIISALSSRFVTFGMSADKSKRVMNGVIQAFGKGKLMAEELTQQISEADPAFKTDLANAIGVTVAELGEMVKAGEITSDRLLELLPLLAKNSTMFGKLGSSATSAVAALGQGQATIEQVQSQLETFSQLNLESFAKLFQPLLGAFLLAQAATVDFITSLKDLESTKFVISIINSIATTLATVFTAATNVITVIAKIVDPIFAAATAFDALTKRLLGFEAIATAVSFALTGMLAKSLYGLAVAAIPRLIAGLAGLNASFALLNGQAILNFITGIAQVVSSTIGSVVAGAKNIVSNIAQAASYKKVEIAAYSAARAKIVEANAGKISAATAVTNIKAGKGVEAALGSMQTASAAASSGFSLSASALGALALAMLPVTYAYNLYKETSTAGTKAGESFDESLKSIREEFSKFSSSAGQAKNDSEAFAAELKKLSTEGRKRNAFEVAIDVVFLTDLNTAIAILHAKAELNKRFKSLQSDVDKTRNSLDGYNAAQDESGEKGARLKAEIDSQVKAYDALRQEAIKTRDELKRKAAANGPLKKEEIIALEKFQEDIKKFTEARDKLIKDAAAKGVEVNAKLSTEGEAKVITTIGGLQEKLKSIKEGVTTAKIGEKGAAETQRKIAALDGLLKFIEDNPRTVKIKAEFDINKAEIASQIEYADALINNAKSRLSVEDSIFGVYKSRNSYAISTAEKELQSLRDRQAGADVIEAKEKQITALKEKEIKIEQNAIANKLQNIGEEQNLERAVLELKQQGQRLDAESAIDAAKALKIQAKKAELVAFENELKAQGTTDLTDDEPAKRLAEYAKEYSDYAEKGVDAAIRRYGILLDTQDLERGTLSNQQAAAKNSLVAQAAQLGLNSSIDAGSTSYGQLNKQVAGFITAGGQTIQVYTQSGDALSGNLKTAKQLNSELAAIPANKNLSLSIATNLDTQSVTNAIKAGQLTLDQPASHLTLPVDASVNSTGFYNEVKQAVSQIQNSDAALVTAQLATGGEEMAASSVQSLTSAMDDYRTSIGLTNRAQGQLQAAVLEYNQALQGGDPGRIMQAAGALTYQKQVVSESVIALKSSETALESARQTAKALGIDIGAVGTQASGAATAIDSIKGSMTDAAYQSVNLSNAADISRISMIDVGTAAQEVGQSISGAAATIGQSWTAALREAATGTSDLGTEVDLVKQEVIGLSTETNNLSTGFDQANTSAGTLWGTTEGIVNELKSDEASTFSEYLKTASENADGVADSGFDVAATSASEAGNSFDSSLESAASQAADIYNTLSNIDSLSPTVQVNVIGTPGRFTGGPVDPGQMYRVNELGKEAFLSASGRLSMINKPRDGMWKAPSRGTVIPAHLTSRLDIPSGGVSLASGASARVSRAASGVSGSASMARALGQALKASGLLETNNNVAVTQAGQATQLGKLTHAVNRLVDKDWNVHVNVKNPGVSPYMDLMNRMS